MVGRPERGRVGLRGREEGDPSERSGAGGRRRQEGDRCGPRKVRAGSALEDRAGADRLEALFKRDVPVVRREVQVGSVGGRGRLKNRAREERAGDARELVEPAQPDGRAEHADKQLDAGPCPARVGVLLRGARRRRATGGGEGQRDAHGAWGGARVLRSGDEQRGTLRTGSSRRPGGRWQSPLPGVSNASIGRQRRQYALCALREVGQGKRSGGRTLGHAGRGEGDADVAAGGEQRPQARALAQQEPVQAVWPFGRVLSGARTMPGKRSVQRQRRQRRGSALRAGGRGQRWRCEEGGRTSTTSW